MLSRLRRKKEVTSAPEAWAAVRMSNLASKLFAEGKTVAALVLRTRALGIDPDDWRIRASLASQLEDCGRIDAARALLDRYDHSQDPKAWMTRAFLKKHEGDLDGALGAYWEAQRLDPKDKDIAFGIATTLLLKGDWERGWLAFFMYAVKDHGPWPRWNGKDRVHHLVVYGDQGVGDILNFSRYVSFAAKFADHTTFVVPGDLCWLLRRFAELEHVTVSHEIPETADAQIALSGLPHYYGTRVDNSMPPPLSILQCDLADFSVRHGKKNVGICWAGNAQYAQDRRRSMSLEVMLPIAGNPRIDLYSFQAGPRAADIIELGAQSFVRDLSGVIANEWSVTAGALKKMDYLVTSDTAIAHLAGVLGVKTLLCLPRVCDWRWLWGRVTTPWYPGMALVRQEKQGDWSDVTSELIEVLA